MTQQAGGAQEWWTAQTHAPARLPRTWWKILQTIAVVAVVGVAISWLVDPSHGSSQGDAHSGLRFFGNNSAPLAVPTPALSPLQPPITDVDPELMGDLQGAADAMEAARDGGGYVHDLGQTDYSQDPNYTVWIVSVNPDFFCLAGGTDQSSPEAYYSSDTGEVSTDPCG